MCTLITKAGRATINRNDIRCRCQWCRPFFNGQN